MIDSEFGRIRDAPARHATGIDQHAGPIGIAPACPVARFAAVIGPLSGLAGARDAVRGRSA